MIVDISQHQGEVDWDALRPHVDFVILRATARSIDTAFRKNARACRERGIPFHAYHFSYATTAAEARKEAVFFWETASPQRPISYVLDIEGTALNGGVNTAKAFVEQLRQLGAGCIGLYMSNAEIGRFAALRNVVDWVWLARYGKNDGNVPETRYEPFACDLWQYTDKGRLPGITANTVDLSVLHGGKPMSYFTGGDDMAVELGSARGDEHGGARGGQAGDQTGKEVSVQNWYKHSKGWRVFRAKDPVAREKIACDMEAACDNFHIGYDQDQRLTLYDVASRVGFDCAAVKTDCETDCSALVRVCCAFAGIMLPNFNTASEPGVLLASGAFDEMTGAKYTDSSDYLLRGDILDTRTQGHTVVVLSNGAKTGGSAALRRGDTGEDVRRAQVALMGKGYDIGPDGPDGDFGKNTEQAVKLFQADNGLTVDGQIGAATWSALMEDTMAPANPMEQTYTVTIRGVPQAEMDAMKKRWPDAEVVPE